MSPAPHHGFPLETARISAYLVAGSAARSANWPHYAPTCGQQPVSRGNSVQTNSGRRHVGGCYTWVARCGPRLEKVIASMRGDYVRVTSVKTILVRIRDNFRGLRDDCRGYVDNLSIFLHYFKESVTLPDGTCHELLLKRKWHVPQHLTARKWKLKHGIVNNVSITSRQLTTYFKAISMWNDLLWIWVTQISGLKQK
jgi:hypothetical protein